MMAISLRPFDPDRDADPIAELITSTNLHDGMDWTITPDVLALEVAPDGYYHPERDTRIAEIDGEPVGFIRVSSRPRTPAKVVHRAEIWTVPERRRRGIGRTLTAWAEERGRRIRDDGSIGGPGMTHVLSGGADEANPASVAFAEAMGYRRIRYSFAMRRSLSGELPDAPPPPGIELRPVVEAHHRPIFDANGEAFRDHWEAAERGDDDFRLLFASPETDTSLWAVAWDADEVAGVSINAIFHAENEALGEKVGWLENISVRRAWRRRGIGAAVIAASLRTLRERGMEEAALGVDAENPTGALALYEGLGFRRHQTFGIYRKELGVAGGNA
jgi:mycothiol synthase